MKLAIYHEHDGKLSTVYDDLQNARLTGSELVFDKGAISGINDNHILLEDDVEPPELLSDAQLYDQKSKYAFEKIDETEELKRQLAETNALILDFMESTLA